MHYRPLLASAIAIVTFVQLTGCAQLRQSDDQPQLNARTLISDIDAFEKQPTAATWEPIRVALLNTPSNAAVESTVVESLAQRPVPQRILNAAAVDLATVDWTGAMKWIRQYNVAAGTDPSARGRQMAGATARLAWLMLALRANYAKDSVDLSYTDLRCDAPFVGQEMNLANVDFSGSRLLGGTWRRTNVGGAAFAGVTLAGDLHCVACSFGGLRHSGSFALVNGRWVVH